MTKNNRKLIHDRHISAKGYLRNDGLWEIEGLLQDTRGYDFSNKSRGEIKAGEPLHQMTILMILDDQFLIHDIKVQTNYGPYRVCGDITPSYEVLKGVVIKPGISRVIREKLSGKNGCVHLTDLLKIVLTTAFQTIGPLKKSSSKDKENRFMKNQCHVYAFDKHKE